MYGPAPFRRAAAALLLALAAPAATALPVGYTSAADFAAAVAALADTSTATLDFEANASGDVVPTATDLGGLSLDFTPGSPSAGLDLVVDDVFSTTSGLNYLGTADGADQTFVDGDGLVFSFGGLVRAIGLFVIGAPGDIFAGDFALMAGGATVANAATADVLADGGEAFFLGLVDAGGAFASASLGSTAVVPGDITYLFNVDDITTARLVAVPEPSPVALALLGGLALLSLRNRNSHWRTNA